MKRMVSPIPKRGMSSQRARRRSWQAEFDEVKPIVAARSRGVCEFPGCTERAVLFHHKKGRLAKNANAPEMLAHVCVWCHSHIHSHVAESYGNGMLVRRGS